MQGASRSFAPLLLVIFLAFLVPVAVSRFRALQLPIVVGEILVGILIGRSGLGWIQHDPVLDLLAEFGFVFLMFLSGMELDFSSLSISSRDGTAQRGWRWGPVQLGLATFLLSLVLSTALGLGLAELELVRSPWMVALIFSTTSLGVVLPVLKERELSTGRYGQTLLLASLIADFATMFLITVYVTLLSQGLTLEILLVGILLVAFVFTYRAGLFFSNRIPGLRHLFEELSHATAQLKVRASFTLMLTFVVLSEVLGAEIILGAFLAGALVSLLGTRQDEALFGQLEAVGFGFFIPIFFIMVGVDFNLTALLRSSQALVLLPALAVAAFAVKVLPGLLLHVQYPWRETVAAGMLLSARLSLIIAASSIGLGLGLIDESVNADIILVAIITVTVAPFLFNRLFPARAAPREPAIVVAGAGQFGLQIADHLRRHGERVVLVDALPGQVEQAHKRGFEVVAGEVNGENRRVVPYFDQAETLICAHTDPEQRFLVCHAARTIYGIERVITAVAEPAEARQLAQLGVKTVTLDLDWAGLLASMARNPAAYELLTHADDAVEVTEVAVRNSAIEDTLLKHLALPGDVRVMAMRRAGELIVPNGRTRLQVDDQLILVGNKRYLPEMRHLFAGTGFKYENEG